MESEASNSSDVHEDAPKQYIVRNANIPYILNGELYEIQTQEGENVTVKCVHCPPDRVYRGSVRSTGNFHMHIKRRHPNLLGKLHEMKVVALLERRDRLIKNRKTTHRVASGSCRSRSSAGNRRLAMKPAPPMSLSPPMMHKLKIKTAFQRHQLQQQQAMRDWGLGGGVQQFVVVPIEASTAQIATPEPINYSLKEKHSMQWEFNREPSVEQKEETISQHAVENSLLSLQVQQSCGQNESYENHGETTIPTTFMYNDQPTYESATIANTPCPSILSSYGGSHLSVGNSHYNSIAIVKNEHLMPLMDQAIDLSMHNSSLSSSGIGSGSDTLPCGIDSFGDSAVEANANLNWNELLLHVQSSLRGITREMRTRNQIETNRIFLDIAKFKYLHPGFNFHC